MFRFVPSGPCHRSLGSIASSVDLWVEQIERLPDDQLTWANVTRKLFHEETRLARLEQRMEALSVSARGTPKRASKTESGSKPVHDPKDDLVCTYCGGTLKTGVSRKQKI